NEVSKKLMCIQMRSGVELWIEDERVTNLKKLLLQGENRFIELDGEIFNRADIVGVFSTRTMSEHTRRKNGEWQCQKGEWHKRKDNCECTEQTESCQKCFVTPCLCVERPKEKKSQGFQSVKSIIEKS